MVRPLHDLNSQLEAFGFGAVTLKKIEIIFQEKIVTIPECRDMKTHRVVGDEFTCSNGVKRKLYALKRRYYRFILVFRGTQNCVKLHSMYIAQQQRGSVK